MSVVISGVVSYVTTYINLGADGAVQAAVVKLLIRQPYPRAAQVEASLTVGHGNAGVSAAALTRQRLRVGTACEAVGTCVAGTDDPRRVVLQGVKYVRGGESIPHHESEGAAA